MSDQYVEQIEQKLADLGVHLSHCNHGENVAGCKYGEHETCPALSKKWSWFGKRLAEAQTKTARCLELERDYHELILAVGNKWPNETRHQTALRYIRQAEEPRGEASCTKN